MTCTQATPATNTNPAGDVGPKDQRVSGQAWAQSPKLNVFALPTRTTVLFALIVLVIMLPILASLTGDTPLCEPFIVFGMLLLPLRSFLRRPDQEMRRGHMTDLDLQFPALARHLGCLSAEFGLCRKPRLLLANKPGIGLYTFGTFTRHHLAIPVEQAARLQADLESEDQERRKGAEAILLHELSHFANQDILPVFFSKSLLWVTILFMSFNLLVSLVQPVFYNTIIRFLDFATLWPPEFLQMLEAADPEMAQILVNPPEVEPATWVRYGLYIFTAHWPLIVGGLALLFLFWRALLRTRELYADARVAQWQGTTYLIQQGILREAVRAAIQPRSVRWRLPAWARQRMGFLSSRWGRFSFLAHHPGLETRRSCLIHPDQVYGSDWAIAATAGFTVVLLNLILSSLLISRYLRGPNATLPFVLGFTVLSLSLLPSVCVFAGPLPQLRRKIVRLVLIFTGIKLIPQYALSLVIVMGIMANPRIIDLAAYTMVGALGEGLPSLGVPVSFVLEVYVLRPAILFTFVMPITLTLFLLLDTHLKRIALTWYGAPILGKNPVALFWGLTGWLALVLWFVVLPFYNVAAAPTAHTLLDPLILGRMGMILLLSVGVVVLLLRLHRRYANRCPACTASVPGPYQLGMSCPHCKTVFHPWLLANY